MAGVYSTPCANTVFTELVHLSRSVVWLLDCGDGPTNKFPFVHRQLKEELIRREDDKGSFAFNLIKFGRSVEPWSSEPRPATVSNVLQAVHWIRDRVGTASIGVPDLLPALRQLLAARHSIYTQEPQTVILVTDRQPSEALGDVLLFLRDASPKLLLNVYFMYEVVASPTVVDFYRKVCSATGGRLIEVELSGGSDMLKTTTHSFQQAIACQQAPVVCHGAAPSVNTVNCCCSPQQTQHHHVVETPGNTCTANLPPTDLVLARRGDNHGYFYLGKTVNTSLAHEKVVQLLEIPTREVIKVSDYDTIPIREAMGYAIFPGSRVLGKLDSQRFCPGTVLHGSIDASSVQNRESLDNLIIQYLDGEVRATAPKRVVRIPESLFYWLKKYFPEVEPRDLSLTDALRTSVTLQPQPEPCGHYAKHKLDRFFEETPRDTSWWKHKYSDLPSYDFEKNKYARDRELIRWYKDRYTRPVFDSDSEDEEVHLRREPRDSKLRLKQSWYDRYLQLREKEREVQWYRKLLERENDVYRRKSARRSQRGLAEPPNAWRQWLNRGQEPPPNLQKQPRVNHQSTLDRSTSTMGIHTLPNTRYDSVFGQVSGHGKDRITVKKLLIQTDPKEPMLRPKTADVVYNKRW